MIAKIEISRILLEGYSTPKPTKIFPEIPLTKEKINKKKSTDPPPSKMKTKVTLASPGSDPPPRIITSTNHKSNNPSDPPASKAKPISKTSWRERTIKKNLKSHKEISWSKKLHNIKNYNKNYPISKIKLNLSKITLKTVKKGKMD